MGTLKSRVNTCERCKKRVKNILYGFVHTVLLDTRQAKRVRTNEHGLNMPHP